MHFSCAHYNHKLHATSNCLRQDLSGTSVPRASLLSLQDIDGSKTDRRGSSLLLIVLLGGVLSSDKTSAATNPCLGLLSCASAALEKISCPPSRKMGEKRMGQQFKWRGWAENRYPTSLPLFAHCHIQQLLHITCLIDRKALALHLENLQSIPCSLPQLQAS